MYKNDLYTLHSESKMYLELSNFKGYKDFSIEIPDTGITLIDGPSGTGKTTLLDALSFVFHDHLKDGAYPRNGDKKEKTWVKFTTEDLTIFRQKRPDYLVVIYKGKELIDQAAQGWIDTTYGNSQVWACSTYMKQDTAWHFLTLTSNDKLAVLQNIAARLLPSESNFDTMYTRVLDLIKVCKSQLEETRVQMRVKEEVYTRLSGYLQTENTTWWNQEDVQSRQDKYGLVSLFSDRSNMDIISMWYTNEIDRVSRDLSDTTRWHDTKKSLDTLSDRPLEEIQKEIEYLRGLLKVSKEIELEIIQNSLISELKELGEIQEVKYTVKELQSMEDALSVDINGITKDHQMVESVIEKTKNGISMEISLIESSLEGLSREDPIEELTKKTHQLKLACPTECPKCNHKFYISGGSTIDTPDEIKKDIDVLQSKKIEYTKRKELETRLGELKKKEKYLNGATDINGIPSDISQLVNLYNLLTSKLYRYKEIPHTLDQIKDMKEMYLKAQKAKELKEKIQFIPDNHRQLSVDTTEVKGKLETLEALYTKIKGLESQLGPVPKESIETLQAKLLKLKQDSLLEGKLFNNHIVYFDLLGIRNEYTVLQTTEATLDLRLQNLEKIKSVMVLAEYTLLDNTLTMINDRVNEMLKAMFDVPITVSLKAIRKLVTGDRLKPEVNIKVVHKEAQLKNLNDLSGGEKSRLYMALMMAFAEVCKSPFIILDECVSSLDVHLREQILEFLKETTHQPVIMVNHDTTKGFYDNVIDL